MKPPGSKPRTDRPHLGPSAIAKFRLLTVIDPSSNLITISVGEWPPREEGSITLFDGLESMVKNKLNKYAAALSPAEIAEGMNAAGNNACRLRDDAKRLLADSRFPTALSLATLSIEESGKVSILRSLAMARNQKEVAETWQEYRSHTRKNRIWPLIETFAKGARRLGDFRELFDDDAEHPFLLDNLKQLGFYTDCLGKKHWSIPDQVIDGDLARQIVQIADILSQKREVTEREVVLWVQYLQPVWKGPMEQMEAAMAAWHRQMCAEGLATDPDLMERFIVQGIGSESDEEQSSNNNLPEGTR